MWSGLVSDEQQGHVAVMVSQRSISLSPHRKVGLFVSFWRAVALFFSKMVPTCCWSPERQLRESSLNPVAMSSLRMGGR